MAPTPLKRDALVLTVSDGVSAGQREDQSGRLLAQRLVELGFSVEQALVPDDAVRIVAAVRGAVSSGDCPGHQYGRDRPGAA